MKKLNSITTSVLIASLLLPLLLLLPAPAYASTPLPMRGNGTFTATIYTETTLSSVGGNTLYYFTGVDALTGTEIGTATVTFLLMVFPSGHDDASGTITCASCTIDGVAGAFVIQFESQGTFGGSSVGIAEASGSGGLATFHGVATFSSVTTSTGFAGPYQLEYTL